MDSWSLGKLSMVDTRVVGTIIFSSHLGAAKKGQATTSLDSIQDSVVLDGELRPTLYAHLRC